jgi:hypothetical protein
LHKQIVPTKILRFLDLLLLIILLKHQMISHNYTFPMVVHSNVDKILSCLLIIYRSQRFCIFLLDPSWRNWFRISQLTSMVAIGLQKANAKTEVGKSCTCVIFIDSRWWWYGYFFTFSLRDRDTWNTLSPIIKWLLNNILFGIELIKHKAFYQNIWIKNKWKSWIKSKCKIYNKCAMYNINEQSKKTLKGDFVKKPRELSR